MSVRPATPAIMAVETSPNGLIVSAGGERMSEAAVDPMVATVVVSLYDEGVL